MVFRITLVFLFLSCILSFCDAQVRNDRIYFDIEYRHARTSHVKAPLLMEQVTSDVDLISQAANKGHSVQLKAFKNISKRTSIGLSFGYNQYRTWTTLYHYTVGNFRVNRDFAFLGLGLALKQRILNKRKISIYGFSSFSSDFKRVDPNTGSKDWGRFSVEASLLIVFKKRNLIQPVIGLFHRHALTYYHPRHEFLPFASGISIGFRFGSKVTKEIKLPVESREERGRRKSGKRR